MAAEVDLLGGLEAWYLAQCDGDWEHTYGITIETLDNPGWRVRIDLRGTSYADSAFDRRETHRDEHDWLVCWVEDEKFQAFCGPRGLAEALGTFVTWVKCGTG